MEEAVDMCPERATEEVKELQARGVAIELVELNNQCYALVKGIKAESPPWSKISFDILIAIPAAYDDAQLDAFYVEWPCSFNNGEHNRTKGDIIELNQRKWRLVSWHYPEDRPWKAGQDSIESHIVHCEAFFKNRGAKNAA
jgi:hypothetical protein